MKVDGRQLFFMERLVETIHQVINDEDYETRKYWWNTVGKNFLYNIAPGNGYDTGLISEAALEVNDKYRTFEHVYSNVKMFNYLVDKHRGGNVVDIEYLTNNVESIVPLITTTKKENHKLTKVTKIMSIEQIHNMEHYKKLGIKLRWNLKSTKANNNVTDAMKELVISN